MEAVETGIVAAVGGGELTVDRVRAEVRALSEGIAAKQVSQSVSQSWGNEWGDGIRTFPFPTSPPPRFVNGGRERGRGLMNRDL